MIRVVEDRRRCRELWRAMVPVRSVFDRWDFRECFDRHYGCRPQFYVAQRNGRPTGLLALSETDDGSLVCFPGESYHGRTWLERNVLIADGEQTACALLEACADRPLRLRYLQDLPAAVMDDAATEVDEIGYLMRPGDYGYSFEAYMNSFSGKSRKKLARELDELEALGVEIVRDRVEDAERVFDLNLEAFGEASYFADERFLAGFRDAVALLDSRGMLSVTTVRLGGRVAAVDIAAVDGGGYVVLAGGASQEFRGVAKLINFNHLKWACENRIEEVDFLCGDFGWKERFHLSARPLYMINRNAPDVLRAGEAMEMNHYGV